MSDAQIVLSQLNQETDPHKRGSLCEEALALIARERHPALWADLKVDHANCLVRDHLGDRTANLERAIANYIQALAIRTREASPNDWGEIQNNLGIAYAERVSDDRADNIEQAIKHYSLALMVRTREVSAEAWAATQGNKANAYFDRIRGDRADNIECAIRHYKQCLEVYTSTNFPLQWAATQNNLATACHARIRGLRADNLEQAILHLNAALEVRTLATLPTDWATTQHNLAVVHSDRIFGNRAENLERAIEHAKAALTVRTMEALPRPWATTQDCLAGCYLHRLRGTAADNVELAIKHYKRALSVRTREALPRAWAMTQHNLAFAYSNRIRGDSAHNLERAIGYAKAALTVRTRDRYPWEWAETQTALATIFRQGFDARLATDLECAIALYEQALQVHTRNAFPEAWARTQLDLGLTYQRRVRGDRTENFERAIDYCRRALEIYTRAIFPEDWARAQHDLANAYSGRIQDEHDGDGRQHVGAQQRADSVETAIYHYEQALTVQTREALPRDWARTQDHLAQAYTNRLHGRRAENIERAISHFEAALLVRTRVALPDEWAETQNKLGAAFYNRRLAGDRAENLERAIAHYLEALTVRTREVLPRGWAELQNNLGLAYRDRIRGDCLTNLKQAGQHLQAALQVYTRDSSTAEYRIVQHNLGSVRLAQGELAQEGGTQKDAGQPYWAAARDAFAEAIAAGEDLFAAAYTEAGRRAEAGQTSRLHADYAWCLLRLKRPADAFMALERGKTRLLNEALALRSIDLTALPDAEGAAVEAARQRVRELEAEMRHYSGKVAARTRELAEQLREARSSLAKSIDTISVLGHRFRQQDLGVPELLDMIPEGGALVAFLVAMKGSAAFVLPHGITEVTEAHVVMVEGFTDDDLLTLLLGRTPRPWGLDDPSELGGWLKGYAARLADRPTWLTTLEDVGRVLWTHLAAPIHLRLGGFGLKEGAPVLLLSHGNLNLLPMHAAWRKDADGNKRYLLDDYTLTIAPSGYVISASRKRLLALHAPPAVVVFVDPTGSLLYAPVEGQSVLSLFEPAARDAPPQADSTVNDVVRGMTGRSYIHFACHGSYNHANPMQSGLDLAQGERLTLARIVSELDLSAARLVVLSACETGLTDVRQSPDEYIGLTAGFLQAGAPAVISSLWPVDDLSTSLLMKRLYQKHLSQGLAPAAALRQAQVWLRDITARRLASYYQNEEAVLLAAGAASELAGDQFLRFASCNPDKRPFEHPNYWAAFSISGL
jgi:CHAT domain-containing protein/tetratricopeptide (TPR) repeat protein